MRTSLHRLSTASFAVLAALALGSSSRAASSGLSPHDLALLNRLSWGESPDAAAEMSSLGAKAWVERQLRGGDRLPDAAQAEIAALAISQTSRAELAVRMDAQNRAANQTTDPDQKKAAQQAYNQAMNDL